MAKVKFPLYSISASGSIGKTMCFHPVAVDQRLTIPRRRGEKSFIANYQPRYLSGRGIVRLKPQKRGDLTRRIPRTRQHVNAQAQLQQNKFNITNTLSMWIVKHNLSLTTPRGTVDSLFDYPWWQGIYFARGETVTFNKFPGQPVGETLAIRRALPAARTARGYVMKQLLGKRNYRFDITYAAWQRINPDYIFNWAPRGSAPWSELPFEFELTPDIRLPRAFMNFLMQSAFLISQFSLSASWIPKLNTQEWHTAPKYYELDDPVVTAWEDFISGDRDFTIAPVRDWSRENG